MLDEFEIPELKDLRLCSGVVLEDDGVMLFRGSMEGDAKAAAGAVKEASE